MAFDVNLTIRTEPDTTTAAKLDTMLSMLHTIITQGGMLMTKADDMLVALVEANKATNEIANDLDALIAQKAGPLSEAEATEVQTQLDLLKIRLLNVASQYTPPTPTP